MCNSIHLLEEDYATCENGQLRCTLFLYSNNIGLLPLLLDLEIIFETVKKLRHTVHL